VARWLHPPETQRELATRVREAAGGLDDRPGGEQLVRRHPGLTCRASHRGRSARATRGAYFSNWPPVLAEHLRHDTRHTGNPRDVTPLVATHQALNGRICVSSAITADGTAPSRKRLSQ